MKPFIYALLLGSALLVGCNDNDTEDAINDVGNDVREGIEDVGEGVREGARDVREGVNDALDNDAVDNDINENDDRTNQGLRNNDVMPDDKGVTGDERGNQEDVIEDRKDIRDADRKDE
ncbi:hypothetical protein NST62_01780 [Ureibacillus sp. FSL K6-8385]|uniref:YtxH domain-containing protein n=1 Tax=Ureibacillus terrenus TaxID=118246 RepID=A0A540V2H1_9BACL|nr:hypothetical protein [Ureibacillus terrenus]TQE90918.1 hypothetical protein FKZ59_07890 [Ureibacillus terrenus]